MARQQRSVKSSAVPARRTYTMRQRRAAIDETHARILDAAIELYETAGPSGSSMSAIAERAGVTRATLYRHFASEDAVARAVIAAWREAWPELDAADLGRIADPTERLRSTLTSLYAGYRATEALSANLARDRHALPEGLRASVREPASRALEAIGGPSAGASHATAFETWQSLRNTGLDDPAIADLMSQFIALSPGAPPRRAAATRASRTPAAAPPAPASVAVSPPAAEPRQDKGRGKAKGRAKDKAGTKKKGKGDRKAKA